MHLPQRGFDMEFGAKLFKKYWHMVCHRNELPNDGDFLRFKTPIGDVVIFNDAGDYVAFDNRCAHRGALIYLTDFGNQANTCRYHGWSFKAGKLIIPVAEQFKDCSIDKADLNRYKLDWCGDFLFVGIDPQNDLYEQLDGVAEYLENISFNISGRLDASAYEYECAWPLALENALEPYHIGMVHPDTLANLKLEDGVNTFYGSNSVWQAPVGDIRLKKQLARLGSFFNIDYGYEGYMSIFMFPFTMISSTYGYSYSLQNFFPHQTRHDLTNFMSRLLTCHVKDERSQKIVQPFFDSSAKVNRMVFEEDHSICKLIPADSWSSEPLKFISKQEVKIAHFRDLCRANLT
jgi:phenylpropionate dioxygenase-like ring-hydroxylating dioxygenase large terminal subunit